MKKILALTLLFLSLVSYSQDKPAYVIYNSNGKKVSFKKMMKKLSKSNVILFGEQHNNAIAHWLELEVAKGIQSKQLKLGAEMIESDNQDTLDTYLSGKIDEAAFDSTTRLWSNYYTDYRPLVEFAKENEIPFIASNIPRRYARLVYRSGFDALDSLTKREKAWIAPLPILYNDSLPGYQRMRAMGGHGHEMVNLPKAQAIKDATMAYFILKNYKPGDVFLHFNGAYHSNYFEGIYWYLQQSLKLVSIFQTQT